MSRSQQLENILRDAKEKERDFHWPKALELYERASDIVGEKDFLRKGEIQEKISYAFYRAARQAEAAKQFKDGMHHAVASYEKAAKLYEKSNDLGKTPRMIRCNAMVAYLSSWLATEVSEKKRLLSECWKLTKEALKALQNPEDALEYSNTYDQLSSAASRRIWLEWDFRTRGTIVREMKAWGEKAIALLSSVEDTYELAGAYVKTALCTAMLGQNFLPEVDEKVEYSQKSLDYWEKATSLSEEAALLGLLSPYLESLGWGVDEQIPIYEKALGYAEKTKDKYMIGTALDMLAYFSHWKAKTFENPDKCLEMYQRALKYAEDANRQHSSISYTSNRTGVLWSGSPYVEHYWACAGAETDLTKRRDLLEKAVANGTHAVELAESMGDPDVIGYAHHVFSKALGSLEQMETIAMQKKKLLEIALEHRKESVKTYGQIERFAYWNLGVMWNYSADLKAELSDYEKGFENRKKMLEEAVSDKEQCLQLCKREIPYWTKIGEFALFFPLGRYQYSYGELLSRLYGLTNNNECQKKAIDAFEEAAESFKNLDMTSRMAECYWKAARGYDALGEHQKAAENFKLASSNYASAAEKIPQLKKFYGGHSLYMSAWIEIEKARHYHRRQQYGVAKEHFEEAARIHKSLKQWNYLSLNYSAWALVEQAEELSRKEQGEEAIQAFDQGVKLFIETEKALQKQLNKVENRNEKHMVTNLVKATDLRRKYCIGRITLEEAKILDQKGDHFSSSDKYGAAVETFERITQALEFEHDRKEFKLIIILSKAWQKMTQAEAEASPTLYLEASQLFEQAKEHSSNEKAKKLALGHSRFSMALEAGTKFADSRDAKLHATAMRHLESAANYYLKAGFRNASEYARATQHLFDAYLYMNKAKTEIGPAQKVQYYQMAEKLLQASAGSYMKAKHPEKSEEVGRLLESVKEERKLATSLAAVLHAPITASTTASFSAPTPTHEQAVGLERFEHADIQANLILNVREVKVGDFMDLEIELINTGKAPALLVKIEKVIPEGFEVQEVPEIYRVEDSHLNMKGKRLNPLKTEEVRMVVKPLSKGKFTMKPRIRYLDENGKYKSHEPEPVTLTVKELGISGWIRGDN